LTGYKFQEGQPLPDLKSDFDPWLFHLPQQLSAQAETGWRSFHVVNQKYNAVVAYFPIHVSENVALSPVRSPFGSIQLSSQLEPLVIFEFVEYINSRLKDAGVNKIRLKNPPDAYQAYQAPILNTIFLNLGYRVSNSEIGAVLSVSPEAFTERIDPWEMRKLRQAQQEELSFIQEDRNAVEEIFSFIESCRDERGYSLSMNLIELKDALQTFPDHYIFFGVRNKKELAAAAVCIRINENILYTFLYAHAKKYDHLSPAVKLIKNIYLYCQRHHISLIDLGTSALENRPNFNVLDFKLRLGTRPSMKLTFEKELQ
jgi:hypothetical protein